MGHYEDDRWIDYARGLVKGSGQAEMKRHLDTGCVACTDALQKFQAVVTAAAREDESEPPAWAMRSVGAYFSLQQAGRAPSLLQKIKLLLAFDSFNEPAPVGTRSLDSSSRQLVYYGNDYALTLRMDYESELSLGGELLHRKSGPVANVPALLMSGHSVLGYSLSGELGDFQMSCGREEPLRLRMLMDGDELIEIDLEWSSNEATQ